MGQSWFAWNGIDCRAMGITLAGPVPIVRPEERVEHVTIPGRPGELTITEGDDIYQSYIQSAEIQVRGGYRVRDVYNWLKGAGEVVFHGEPEKKQKARIIGAVTLEKHSRNLDIWTGSVQFYCEPFKMLLNSITIEALAYSTSKKYAVGDLCIYSGGVYRCTTAITSGETWTSGHWESLSGVPARNAGDIPALPQMIVTASGTTMGIAAGGRLLTITGTTANTVYTVDCDSRKVMHMSSGTLVDDTKLTSGPWPQLLPGNNNVTGSGWSSIVIDRRERFL